MQTIATLELITTTVGPEDTVGEIRHLARAHGPLAVGVLHDEVLIGVLHCKQLLRINPSLQVRELMEPPVLTLEGSSAIRRVAQDFLGLDVLVAPVFRDHLFLGLVTMPMLLREVGRSWDPLTGLGWSDRLREWGMARLREGKEITVLFIDLDNFGQYNKRYGHLVGDHILQSISSSLNRYCEQGMDLAVRYGGDEFAIGTLREREAADQLLDLIQAGMAGLMLEQDAAPVTFSIGICGGRRTIERDQIHYAATMDNLINLSSKDCMSRKSVKAEVSSLKG